MGFQKFNKVVSNMYSDLIEENLKLQERILELENAITEHATRTRTFGQSPIDVRLWRIIGLHVYTDAEKNAFDETAPKLETEAQKLAEGFI